MTAGDKHAGFPPSGHLLDSFARAALWDSGLDYLHGTGHGVGCFLNVHEGPCGISYKTFADEPLEAGMIVSDGMNLSWVCPCLAQWPPRYIYAAQYTIMLE